MMGLGQDPTISAQPQALKINFSYEDEGGASSLWIPVVLIGLGIAVYSFWPKVAKSAVDTAKAFSGTPRKRRKPRRRHSAV
jgi:hypothetical protein